MQHPGGNRRCHQGQQRGDDGGVAGRYAQQGETQQQRVGNGIARFASGPAPEEDVRMEQTWETAVGVATGSLPAQEAFIKGHVRISGDTQRLMDAVPVFAALDAAFEAVRSLTTYE